MIVVDASAMFDALLYEGAATERLADEWLCAPYLIDAEVLSGLRANVRNGTIETKGATIALSRFGDLQVLRYPHEWLIERAWDLRDNVTSYDALYVALAEMLDEVLVTTDARLAKAPGIRARVEVLPLSA
ncbi:MAG: type II toxin-antitoxin system VapC family toxin [Acidimicrobiales bacterium]